MRLIVGLGNPGIRYRRTRHNLGFQVLDRLAASEKTGWKKKRTFPAWLARSGKMTLVKPATYVNLSGRAVRAALDYYNLDPGDLVVVVDDVNLPAGTIRIRDGGGSGGHHGLESIIRALGTREFTRVRVGVGGGHLADLTGHVLSRPGREESRLYGRAAGAAGEAVRTIVEEGTEAAMNTFNRKIRDNHEEEED